METDRIELSSPLLGMQLLSVVHIALPIERESPMTQGLAMRSPVDLEVLE